MTKSNEEIHIQGVPIADGIAIGALHFLKINEQFSIPEFSITFDQVSGEIDRYRKALVSSREELEKLQFLLYYEGSNEAAQIIESHIKMLEDPLITIEIEEKIGAMLKNTESVFHHAMNDYKKLFININKRDVNCSLLDVQDLLDRILKHLLPNSCINDESIPSHCILSARELFPTAIARVSTNHIRAIVTEIGGMTSHIAIIARSRRIPYVSNIDVNSLEKISGVNVIIDGNSGKMIINPQTETVKWYKREKKEIVYHLINEKPKRITCTSDGVEIDVQANLDSLYDLKLLKEYNVGAIGLLRSEFLYLQKETQSFNEEEQFVLYKRLMQLAGNIEVSFRVFDVGSDKNYFKLNLVEPNPALGCRSIRFLMKHKEIFASQIRAILRAANFGKLKLLLPLISDVEELKQAKEFIYLQIKQLKKDGHIIKDSIQIGCMVEAPSFVIMCDQIIKECDFLSIGTNDLTQYTLAIDRSNPQTCDIYTPLHPSIIRMIKQITEEADRQNVPIGICGEVASNQHFTPTLIGIGLRKISCAARFIPMIRKVIENVNVRDEEIKLKSILR